VINDNAGREFDFAPCVERGEGWVALNLIDDPARARDLNLPEVDRDQAETVALGAIQVTDALIVGIPEPPAHIDIDPRFSAARRGAWYSLGFVLREASARYLDIESQELRVGLRLAGAGTDAHGEIFIADSLENGAGYSTHLGREPHFERVLEEASSYLTLLRRSEHADVCDSSCYDCLRDYFNANYHPLLDWRLGRDMLDLLEGRALDVAAWHELEARISGQLASDFAGTALKLDGDVNAVDFGTQLMLVVHPLESQHQHPRRLGEAIADAEERGFGELSGRPIVLRDSFDLIRRPGWVAAQLV